MLPDDWTPHRRDDGELLGWIWTLPWPAPSRLRPARVGDPDGRTL